MKQIIYFTLLLVVLGACQTKPDNKNSKKMKMEQKEAVKKVLLQYRDALNSSEVDNVLPLYARNGVFMPSSGPTAIGLDQIKGAYEFVFSSIELSIDFTIDEIEVVEDYAFARSTSKGTTLIHATGETVDEENRELFILKKEDSSWKIDRYMFNKMSAGADK